MMKAEEQLNLQRRKRWEALQWCKVECVEYMSSEVDHPTELVPLVQSFLVWVHVSLGHKVPAPAPFAQRLLRVDHPECSPLVPMCCV